MTAVFAISRQGEGPHVLWGGLSPSGSLKVLTFERFLARQKGSPQGFVEISGGSTAMALEHLARARGVPVAAVVDVAGAEHLRRRGYCGELHVAADLDGAVRFCMAREAAGWLWPRQMTNTSLVDDVEGWAVDLAIQVQPLGVRVVVCGFGTGATAAGLWRVFHPRAVSVRGVQSPAGVLVHGWRNFSEQNLGANDLFEPFRTKVDLIDGDPRVVHAPLEQLLAVPLSDARHTLIVTHEGRP